MFRIHADQQGGRSELSGRHDRDPFGIRHDMVRREDIPIMMDNDPAASRLFYGQRLTLIRPSIRHGCEQQGKQG
jgi:hypothetical protein